MKVRALNGYSHKDRSSRYLYGTIGVLAVSPFVYYVFLYIQSQQTNLSVLQILNTDGLMCINLIASFSNLITAIILRCCINAKSVPEELVIHFFIFAVSQACVLNYFYLFLMIFMIYKILGKCKTKLKESFTKERTLTNKRFISSLVILCVHLFLLFTTLRLVF